MKKFLLGCLCVLICIATAAADTYWVRRPLRPWRCVMVTTNNGCVQLPRRLMRRGYCVMTTQCVNQNYACAPAACAPAAPVAVAPAPVPVVVPVVPPVAPVNPDAPPPFIPAPPKIVQPGPAR